MAIKLILRKLSATARIQRGQVLTLGALAMTGMMGFTALSLDVGNLYYQKRLMQTAADAAAVSGAYEVIYGSGDTQTAALTSASENGFSNGVKSVAITVNNPPASGAYAGNSEAVEVIINAPEPTYFARALGINDVSMSARAVARVVSSSYGVYVLDPHASSALGTLSLSGGATITANTGIIVDSDSSSALSVSGGATLTASGIGVAGGYTDGGGGSINPTPVTGVAPVQDPLAALPAPSYGSCDYTNYSVGNGNQVSLSPGVYCGGMQIGGGATVSFSPGTYILNGGGMTVSNGASVSGSGVTFYNTAGSGQTFAPMSITGGGTINLSAPTSGTYEGILAFQDRNISSTATNTFDGGSNLTINGAIYMPDGSVVFSGGSSTAAYTILIADTVSLANGADTIINADYSSLQDGSPVKTVVLGE
jgi:Flp pilus assembly protein TadG